MCQAFGADRPHLIEKNGRYALQVDGMPYLILGGQIHNSSGWPIELPQVWESMAALHANTVEAPVYWEQFEPQPGKFDFTNVDAIVLGAREHKLHVVILWFGTWKNGNMHYVPTWVKSDTVRFSRIIRADGEPIDVLSPISRNTLEADKAAFTALMRHLNQIDGDEHTVLLIQVENESGNIGSVRDFSAESNREFAGQVPSDLLAATGKHPGTWSQVFSSEADELFQAITRQNTSTRLWLQASTNSTFRITSTCGSIIRLRNCPNARSINRALGIRAAELYRSSSACGAN